MPVLSRNPPPKKEGSGKKKLSKAEKEKLKKEEAERKAEEEEEARLKAEQEEKEQKKKEKALEFERKKLENEEKKHRKVDMCELNDLLDINRKSLEGDDEFRRKTAKWERYMRCDGSPDPTQPAEINTYINLKREDKTRSDIEDVLTDSVLHLSLIQELNFLIEDSPAEELKESQSQECKHTIRDLQSLLQYKLDAASHEILLKATELQDPETLNLQFTTKNENICLCVWGNISKNPRIKSYEFAEKGFTFEIPKLLTLSECAFRILFTKYDHYSEYCKTYLPRLRKIQESPPEITEDKPEDGEKEEEKKEDGVEDKPEGEGQEELEREDTMDLMASLREINKGKEEEEEKEGEKEAEAKEEEEEWEDPTTPELAEWEDFDGEDDVVDLRAYQVIGGVFHFNLLHLPPQPKSVKGWIMTQLVNPPELENLEYTADPPVTATPNKEQKDNPEEKKRDEKPPIGVTMRLPEDVYFMEEPQIGRWDEEKLFWKLDGTDITYNEDNRILQFKTSHFGSLALLQDTHINMPFQSWEIRPRSANRAVFTIIAAIVELEIEIKDAICCLSKPDDRTELKHLKDKWMSPKLLIKALQEAGVNVFPSVDSAKYVAIQKKSPVVEERLYEQMALTASAMAYSWSKWNSECEDRDKIIFQGSEALQDEPLLEEDWSVFLVSKCRAMKLQMTEYDENFSEEMADDSSFRSNLYHLMKTIGSEAAKERIDLSTYQFVDCVQQLLSATKFLTYA